MIRKIKAKITSVNMGLICSYIGNGVDAFEGDIMMTAEQWEEVKRDFKRTGQPVPIKQSPQNR